MTLDLATFIPTQEQEDALQMFVRGECMRIEAMAGTGKTTLVEYMSSHPERPKGRILYTAFGNKVVAEAKQRFPRHVRCSTNHGLARGYADRYFQTGRLQDRLTPNKLRDHFRWKQGDYGNVLEAIGLRGVMNTLNRFCQSADTQIKVVHALPFAVHAIPKNPVSAADTAAKWAGLANAVWEEWIDMDSRLPITHDVYLKRWAMTKPTLPYEIIMLDEAQDANPVIVDVLHQQTHAQIVIVGDRRQAIFGFRGAIDAMDAFDFRGQASLCQSFRFGPAIAAIGNAVLIEHCESLVSLIGDPRQPGQVSKAPEGKRTLLARRNATLLHEAIHHLSRRTRLKIGIVGGVEDLITLVRGAADLMSGRKTQVPELAEFSSWYEVKEAAEDPAYFYLRMLVQLLADYPPAYLEAQLQKIAGHEHDEASCDLLMSTAHKSKGREWDVVVLSDDFPVPGPPDDPGAEGWSPEEGNLLYVAVTRARKNLDISACSAAQHAWGPSPFPTDFESDVEMESLL